MKEYEVTFKHRIVETTSVVIEAENEEEAIRKARDGDYDFGKEEVVDSYGEEIFDFDVEENR